MPLLVEISAGELVDKITILELKLEHIKDPAKLGNVRLEYERLTAALATTCPNVAPSKHSLRH